MTVVALLQLLLLLLTSGAIVIATKPLGEARPQDHLWPGKLDALASDEESFDRELERLRHERISISIYNSQRQLVATNVDPPLTLPPRFGRGGPGPQTLPPDKQMERTPWERNPEAWRDRPFVVPFRAADGRGFLVARGERAQPPGWIGPALIFVSAFSILVLGALVTARWIVRPIHRLSRTARAIGTGNLRARSRLERTDELGELGARIDEMADRIETLLRSEKELLANIAHELRTPLARIGVALDLAAEGDAKAARASLGEIAVDVSELEQIFEDIMTAMKLEITSPSESMPLRRQRTRPDEIVEAALARHAERHPERHIDVDVQPRLPTIDVDPILLRRVIENLLDNAHKYTPDVSKPTHLEVRSRDERIVVEISDRGIGIARDEIPNVFAPFFRADRSRSRETGGIGLGLTLSKRIVEVHGGTIEIGSETGVGTTVRIELPAARAD